MVSSLTGASVWEQELYDYVAGHVENEHEIVESYRDLAEGDTSPAFRYLAKMILDDEVRHHQLFADLAESIRQMAELRSDDDPIPDLHGLAADSERVLATTERFLKIEREDAAALRALGRRLKDVEHTTLWGLLVRLMIDDTEKHIRILRFIRSSMGRSIV